jgi:hypothetical protein
LKPTPKLAQQIPNLAQQKQLKSSTVGDIKKGNLHQIPKPAQQKQLTHTTVGNNKTSKHTSNTKPRPTKTINPYNCRKQQDKQTYIKYQTSPNKNN